LLHCSTKVDVFASGSYLCMMQRSNAGCGQPEATSGASRREARTREVEDSVTDRTARAGMARTAREAGPASEEDLAGDRLLLVDADTPLRQRLARGLGAAGLVVTTAGSAAEARARLAEQRFDHALIDLRLDDGNGLDLIPALRERCPGIRIVVATAFSSIASAVLAIKAGAVDYLSKPVQPGTVIGALLAERGPAGLPDLPMPADRVRWEHIQRVYEQCGRNVSDTARRLGMHRRSLQRMLAKRAPAEQPLPAPLAELAPRRPTCRPEMPGHQLAAP
jgi:two-component system, response regulator RegA